MTPSAPQTAAQTEGEAAMVAHFLDFYRSVRLAGKDAPFGQFLNVADQTTREKGQAFLRSMIEHIAQEEIDEVEKKTKHDSVRPANGKQDTAATALKTSNRPTEP
jgi:hypothetical protein